MCDGRLISGLGQAFAHILSDTGLEEQHKGQNDYIRRSYCHTSIKGIISDVGAPETPDFWEALFKAAGARADKRGPDKAEGW